MKLKYAIIINMATTAQRLFGSGCNALIAGGGDGSMGAMTDIDYASVNTKVFFNNSSIGIYPELVFRREDREARLGKWPAAALSLLDIQRKPLRCFLNPQSGIRFTKRA